MSTTVKSDSGRDVLIVEDVMTRDVITVDSDGMAKVAIECMANHGIRHLVIVSDDTVVGVLSQRDALRHIASHFTNAVDPSRIRVSNFMAAPPVTTTADSPLALAAFIMSERKIGCLPVLDGTRLVGIVTRSDLLQNVATFEGLEGLLVNR